MPLQTFRPNLINVNYGPLWSQYTNVASIWSLKTRAHYLLLGNTAWRIWVWIFMLVGRRVLSFRTWPLSVVFSPLAFSLERMGSFTSYYGPRPEPFMNGMLLSAWHYLENVGQLAGDEEFSSDLCVWFPLLYCSTSLLFGFHSVCLWDLLLDACASDWTMCHQTILGKPTLTYLK